MAKRNNSALYGVFYQDAVTGKQLWGMMSNRRKALQQAKIRKGEVRVIPLGMSKAIWGSVTAWDAPTFRVTSDLVKDYR